ncbi:uncharacterized protein LOC128386706 [Panonychus citri]|uniref:uncharacterized protein LOC128386706 n=1 Tax=Panonychus citri TaxID=50023 RepID=UPI002307AB3F|nr:uncharacterized protein LOC128386706 [Panonychus citri]
MFEEDDDGNITPQVDSVKKFLDLITIYANLNGIVSEEKFYLHSFPRTGSTINQNVIESFHFFTLTTWLIILIVIYFLEFISTYKNLSNRLGKHLISSVVQLPSTIFYQYIAYRSIFRLSQLILIVFLTSIFTASFSTGTISGTGDIRVNTLREIVDYDKTPIFFERISMFDLFERKVTKEYADVYKLAESKGTAKAFTIGVKTKYREYSSDVVAILSDKVGKIGNVIDGTDHPAAKYSYWSETPFYRASSGFIMNPKRNINQIKRRLNSVTSKLLQSSLTDFLFVKIVRELVQRIPLFTVTDFQLNKRTYPINKIQIKYTPFGFSGLRSVIQISIIMILICCIIIFLIELSVGKII